MFEQNTLDMRKLDPNWLAQRHGQDWVDQEVLSATKYLTSVVPSREWSSRMDRVRQTFESAKANWANRNQVPLFNPQDTIAWYVFQAEAYAANREDWYEPDAFRIVPVFKRLGEILPRLESIDGAMDKVQHLMTRGRAQADDGLFELLVASAYKRRWKNVAFVAEKPGVSKTQDILVSTGRRKWAVECKRVNKSGYEEAEQVHAEAMAQHVHSLSKSRGRSIVLEVQFKVELSEVPVSYLSEKAGAFLDGDVRGLWDDAMAMGIVRNVDWTLAASVLEKDDVFFGSSRMVELLLGRYVETADHSVSADWMPAKGRPLYAKSMSQASVVSWKSASVDAAYRKARHFRALVSKAASQLPDSYPGAVHVGYEARNGNAVDELRHYLNSMEMSTFKPDGSRLRWVYGNYLRPEHTTARDESLALEETTATYKIGRHRTSEPLPDHGLFSDKISRRGAYWD